MQLGGNIGILQYFYIIAGVWCADFMIDARMEIVCIKFFVILEKRSVNEDPGRVCMSGMLSLELIVQPSQTTTSEDPSAA